MERGIQVMGWRAGGRVWRPGRVLSEKAAMVMVKMDFRVNEQVSFS